MESPNPSHPSSPTSPGASGVSPVPTPTPAAGSPDAPAETAAPTIDIPSLANEACTVLQEMLALLSFQAQMNPAIESGTVRIHLQSEDAGRLIGRKGSTVNEIQFLLNRILQRRHKSIPRIFLDVDGQREAAAAAATAAGTSAPPPPAPAPAPARPSKPREPRPERQHTPPQVTRVERTSHTPPPPAPARIDSEPPALDGGDDLTKIAQEACKQVARWGDPVDLPPMNESDRKTVCDILKQERELEIVELPGRDPNKKRLRIQTRN
jgi:spoIIIJ-associated protein